MDIQFILLILANGELTDIKPHLISTMSDKEMLHLGFPVGDVVSDCRDSQ